MHSRPRPDSSLVTTAWVAEHLTDPHVVLVEASGGASRYQHGHIAGAVDWNGQAAMAAPIRRPRRFRDAMERLLALSGVDNYTTVVLYGDTTCLAATRAAWCLAVCGHADVRLLDGGRSHWLREGRPLSTAPPQRVETIYKAALATGAFRAVARDLRAAETGRVIVDARPAGATAPGAVSIPWSSAMNDDGTFKSTAALESLFAVHGITRAHHIVTCSPDDTASAHLWFALSRVLGFPSVRNYEGA